ncbi:hypothetical protein Pan216_45880 [Planctomycetes bacterium Pan216]|uniref:Uncharacterized protein n=1 Tax=Kolteria novifilia TaxID=2527975 RepID=A0A518B9U4_9BACT|nr:hypothetical protein Pan216_45880 [Planctomycetes bacterium Pan216]
MFSRRFAPSLVAAFVVSATSSAEEPIIFPQDHVAQSPPVVRPVLAPAMGRPPRSTFVPWSPDQQAPDPVLDSLRQEIQVAPAGPAPQPLVGVPAEYGAPVIVGAPAAGGLLVGPPATANLVIDERKEKPPIRFKGDKPFMPMRPFTFKQPYSGICFTIDIPAHGLRDIDYGRKEIELEYGHGCEIEIDFHKDGRVTVDYDF